MSVQITPRAWLPRRATADQSAGQPMPLATTGNLRRPGLSKKCSRESKW
jgi:hypothetical protein